MLKNNGIEVELFYNAKKFPSFVDDYYTKINKFAGEKNLIKQLKKRKVDIVHCHNFPDSFPIIVKKRLPNMPVIYNIHDLTTAYNVKNINQGMNILEELAFEYADGIVHVSEFLKKQAEKQYPEACKNVKHMVMPNYVLESDVPSKEELGKRFSDSDDIPRVVYQGGISTKSPHRNYLPTWEKISNRGAEVHFYPFFNDIKAQQIANKNNWLYYHAPCKTPNLLRNICRYDVGYVGYSTDFLLLQGASPNKMYEYAACGLPVATQPFEAVVDVVKKHKLGFVWKNLDEFFEKLEDWKDYRKQKVFSFDEKAKDIIKFHEQFI